jgi:hypothetical protein
MFKALSVRQSTAPHSPLPSITVWEEKKTQLTYTKRGRHSRYCDSLRTVQFGVRTLAGARNFLHNRPYRTCNPPSFLHNGYRRSFPRVKRPRHGDKHPPHVLPMWKSSTPTSPYACKSCYGEIWIRRAHFTVDYIVQMEECQEGSYRCQWLQLTPIYGNSKCMTFLTRFLVLGLYTTVLLITVNPLICVIISLRRG